MFGELCDKIKGWISGKDKFNVKVSQRDLKNLSPGKTIIFNNLPELIYNELIGSSIDMEKLQFQVSLEVQYDEEGFHYKEFKLEEEGMEYWLEVIRDMGNWNISIWKRIPDFNQALYLQNGQIVNELSIDEQLYKKDSEGLTDFNMLDENNPTKGKIRYWRFQCQDDPKKLFSVSDWMDSGQYECAKGEWLKESDFEILILNASFT